MKNSIKYIITSFVVYVIVLFTLSWISYRALARANEYQNLVEHTQHTLLLSEEIISSIKDVETGQRGYLLTQQERYLKPYEDAKKAVLLQIDSLKKLVIDNKSQAQVVDFIKQASKKKLFNAEKNIFLHRNGGRIDMAELEEGKENMDNIRNLVSQFQKNEQEMLKKRSTLKNSTNTTLPTYLTMLSMASFLLLFVSFGLIYSEFTRRQKTQKELENKVTELNRSNSELEQFAYVASHDLQEPLRKIRAFSDRLQMRQKNVLNEDGQETLDKIASSATRMQTLIDDLLTFSRMVNPRSQVITEVNLNNIMKDVLVELSEEIKNKRAVIMTETLPIIDGYSFQMRQLLMNLLSNSLKFARFSVMPEIQVTCHEVLGSEIKQFESVKKQETYYAISVRDNGVGFEPEYADKIFIIFQRLHNRTDYQGTGIGLAICRRVVSNHHGFIYAESELNKGAAFTFFLPKKNKE